MRIHNDGFGRYVWVYSVYIVQRAVEVCASLCKMYIVHVYVVHVCSICVHMCVVHVCNVHVCGLNIIECAIMHMYSV